MDQDRYQNGGVPKVGDKVIHPLDDDRGKVTVVSGATLTVDFERDGEGHYFADELLKATAKMWAEAWGR